MSRIRSLVLGIALSAGTAGVAAAQATAPPTPSSPAPSADTAARPHRGHGRHHGRMKNTLFRGISLTSEQRGQLDTINNKYRSQRESIRRAMQPDLQEARTARQRGDTTAARAAWARTAEQRKQLQTLQEQQLGEIRGTLTSDQQQRFDQNRAARRSKMHGHRTPKPASGA